MGSDRVSGGFLYPPRVSRGLAIGGRQIGGQAQCFVIAEVGVNHNGDPRLAHAMIDQVAGTGADAVKFQVFTASQLASEQAPKARYQRSGGSAGQQEMLRSLELDPRVFIELKSHAENADLVFLASPFDDEAVEMLDALEVAAFKIPSGEITNSWLVQSIAATGRPILMSTGMATIGEIDAAVAWIGQQADLALLHCVSSYPTALEDCNLRVIPTLSTRYRVPIGWSDHTEGTVASLAAVAIGARLVEKHFTSSRLLPGPDQKASLEPGEFRAMVNGIRDVEQSLGSRDKHVVASEAEVALVARKSLHWRRGLKVGQVVTREDLIPLRPGTGLPTTEAVRVVGRTARVAVVAGTMVAATDLEPPLDQPGQ
jgi:N,N'-diacetyllegionaminate synthase